MYARNKKEKISRDKQLKFKAVLENFERTGCSINIYSK